jgi:hypothetical protein
MCSLRALVEVVRQELEQLEEELFLSKQTAYQFLVQ